MGSVTVVQGPNNAIVAIGKTVGELRRDFAQGFNIPDGASATLDGVQVSDDETPQAGQKLVFAAPAGEKG